MELGISEAVFQHTVTSACVMSPKSYESIHYTAMSGSQANISWKMLLFICFLQVAKGINT